MTRDVLTVPAHSLAAGGGCQCGLLLERKTRDRQTPWEPTVLPAGWRAGRKARAHRKRAGLAEPRAGAEKTLAGGARERQSQGPR